MEYQSVRVQLHGARAQGNHGVDKRDVLVLQHLAVPHNLVLGVMAARSIPSLIVYKVKINEKICIKIKC